MQDNGVTVEDDLIPVIGVIRFQLHADGISKPSTISCRNDYKMMQRLL